MKAVRVCDIPLQPEEIGWILELARGGASVTSISILLERTARVVDQEIVRARIKRPSRTTISPAIAAQARAAVERARSDYLRRQDEMAQQQRARAEAADTSNRAPWRYARFHNDGRHPVVITLARISGITTPIERGESRVYSISGAEWRP